MNRIAHIVAPLKPEEKTGSSSLQHILFETMRKAQEFARTRGIDVTLFSAQFPENRQAMPKFFRRTLDLRRSVLDMRTFQVRYKLPILKDIFEVLYESSKADYFIYTRENTGLLPYFYVTVAELIKTGHDAFVIRSRSMEQVSYKPEDIPLLYSRIGIPGTDHDCFVFQRDRLKAYRLGQACIRTPLSARTLLWNLFLFSRKFSDFKDLHLTFHLGGNAPREDPALREYHQYNHAEVLKVLLRLDQKKGLLARLEREHPKYLQGINLAQIEDMKPKWISHADQGTINAMYRNYAAVFILSTGRSASKFLAELLDLAPNITAFHEPKPALPYFSNFAFHHQADREVLTKMVEACRMEMVLKAFLRNRIYAESNQSLTFFAPVLAGLFQKSKFVHVLRHPGDFVRSAVRKGWHKNDSIWEAGRVRMADQASWGNLDQIEKLSWVWATTHGFIEDFKGGIPPERCLTLRIEDLFKHKEDVDSLMAFAGSEKVSEKKIEALKERKINELVIHPNEPPNMRKQSGFPPYSEWTPEMKENLRGFCGPLAKSYGYDI